MPTVFTALFAIITPDGYDYLPHQEQWERAKLLAWLLENDIDLAEIETLVFVDYDIPVTALRHSPVKAHPFHAESGTPMGV